MKTLFLSLVLASGLVMAGCGDTEDEDHKGHKHDHSGNGAPMKQEPVKPETEPSKGTGAAVLNTKCPIMEDPIDPEVTVDYKGAKVAFCCEDCIPKWEKLSDEEKAKKVGR